MKISTCSSGGSYLCTLTPIDFKYVFSANICWRIRAESFYHLNSNRGDLVTHCSVRSSYWESWMHARLNAEITSKLFKCLGKKERIRRQHHLQLNVSMRSRSSEEASEHIFRCTLTKRSTSFFKYLSVFDKKRQIAKVRKNWTSIQNIHSKTVYFPKSGFVQTSARFYERFQIV